MVARFRRTLAWPIGAAIVAASVGCTSSDPSGSPADAIRALRRGEVDRLVLYEAIEDVLPNVTYEYDEPMADEPFPVTRSAVVGHVTGVRAGKGFDEGGSPREVRFDDEGADWRTIHLTVSVDETIAGDDLGDEIEVGLVIGPQNDLDRVAAGLEEMGKVLLLLQSGSPVFDYDTDLFSIPDDGELLVTIDVEGGMQLPLKNAESADRLLHHVDTVDELRDAAKAPPRTIVVDPDGRVRD